MLTNPFCIAFVIFLGSFLMHSPTTQLNPCQASVDTRISLVTGRGEMGGTLDLDMLPNPACLA